MPALTELRPNGTVVSGFASGSHTDLADESDATYIAGATNTAPGTTRFNLTNVPADFLSVDGNLTITLNALLSASGDDTWTIRAVLCDSTGSTTNYGTSSAAQAVTGSIDNKIFTVTGVTANKTQMDAACVEIIVTRSQNMGGDGNHIRVTRLGVTGNYNSDTTLSGVAETFHAHTSESPSLITPPVYGLINPSEGDPTGSNGYRIVPFTNRRYAAIWNDPQSTTGDKRFKLLRATTTEDGWEDIGPLVTGNDGGIGISNHHFAWRQSDTQAGFLHERYGSGNPQNVYAGCAVYNSGTDSISGGYGSLALTAVGNTTRSRSADRLTDTKAIVAHVTQDPAATPNYIVRARAGTLASGTATTFSFGTIADFGIARGTVGGGGDLVVIGISDTRAVFLHAPTSDDGTTRRIAARIISCTSGSGTTLGTVTAWTDLHTDFLTGWANTSFSARKIDANRILITYGTAATNVSTDRQLKAMILDVSGDTITAGTPIVLASDTIQGLTGYEATSAAVLPDGTMFVAGQRNGNSVTYQSSQTATASNGSVTVTKPTSTAEGDGLIAVVAIATDESVDITPPTGWTLIGTSSRGAAATVRAYTKMAGASEPADYTWSFDTANQYGIAGVVMRFTNAIFDDWVGFDDIVQAGDGSTSSPVAPTLPFIGFQLAVSAVGAFYNHTSPGGYTERADIRISGAHGSIGLAVATDTASVLGGQSATFTTDASTQWATLHIPVFSEASQLVGWILDPDTSGTTLTTLAGPKRLITGTPFPRLNGATGDQFLAYPTTESTPGKVVIGVPILDQGEPNASSYLRGIGFIATPTGEEWVQTATDPVGITDSVTAVVYLEHTQTVTGTLGLTDDGTFDTTTNYEVVGITDAVSVESGTSGPQDYTKTISSSIGALDTSTRVWAAARRVGAHVLDEGSNPVLDEDGFFVLQDHDPIGVSDAATAAFVFTATISDGVGNADSHARVYSASQTVTDQVQITDAIADQDYVDRIFLELIGLLDSNIQSTVLARAPPAEQVGLLDDTSRAAVSAREPIDPVGLVDSQAQTAALSRSRDDGVGITDSLVQDFEVGATDHTQTVSDEIGILDALTGEQTVARSVDDSAGLIDTFVQVGANSGTSSDAVGLLDAITVEVASSRSIVDGVGASDGTASSTSRTTGDNVGLTDAASRAVTFGRLAPPATSTTIAYRGAGALAAAASGTSLSVPLPSTVQSGDLVMVVAWTNLGTTGLIIPSGSAMMPFGDASTAGGNGRVWMGFYQRADAFGSVLNGNPSVNVSGGTALSATNGLFARAYAFSGVLNTRHPSWGDAVAILPYSPSVDWDAGGTSTVTGPPAASHAAFTRLVSPVMITTLTGTWSGSVPTGWTAVGFASSTVANDGSVDLFHRSVSGIGLQAGWSRTLTGSRPWTTSTWALHPEGWDRVGVTDSRVQATGAQRTVSDVVGVSDSVAVVLTSDQSVADLIGVADTAEAQAVLAQAVVDAIGILDAFAQVGASSGTSSDPVGITDAVSFNIPAARQVDDDLGLTDAAESVWSGIRHVGAHFFDEDDQPILDEDGNYLLDDNDPVGVSDDVSVSTLLLHTAVVTDGLDLSDTASTATAATRAVDDVAGTTDQVDITIDAERTAVSLVGLADTFIQVGANSGTSSDSVGITDAITVAASIERTADDAIAITDDASTVLDLAAAITDQVGITDQAQAQRDLAATLTDPIGVTDAVSPGVDLVVTITDLVGIAEGGTGGTLPTLKVNGNGNGSTHQPRGWAAQSYLNIDEDFTSPDGEGITGPLGAGGDTSFQLEATPSDLASITDLSIRVRARTANRVDDGITLLAKVVDPNDGSVLAGGGLADEFILISVNGSGADTNYGPITFPTVDNSATKEQWDRAVLVLRQGYAPIGGGDLFIAYVVDVVALDGTYVAAGGVEATVGYQQAVTDQVGIADTFARVGANSGTSTDPIGISDPFSQSGTAVSTSSDAVGIADSVNVVVVSTRDQTANVGLLDAAVVVSTTVLDLSDEIGVVDALSISTTTSVTDSVGILDGAAQEGVLVRSVDDEIGLADTLTWTQDAAVSDALGLLDSATSTSAHLRTVDEAIGITDTFLQAGSGGDSSTDQIGISDSMEILSAAQRVVDDLVGLSDDHVQAGEYGHLLIDGVALNDDLNLQSSAQQDVADALAILDEVSAGSAIFRTVDDGAGILDTFTQVGSGGDSSTDPVGVSDSIIMLVESARTPVDDLGLLDAVAASAESTLVDVVGIGDAVSVEQVALRSVDDSVQISDALLDENALDSTILDQVGLLDAVALAGVGTRLADDPVGLADDASSAQTAVRQVDDLVGALDAVIVDAASSGVLVDPIGISDSITFTVDVGIDLHDDLGLTDASARAAIVERVPSDNLSITDASSGAGQEIFDLLETIGLVDSTSSGLAASHAPTDVESIVDSVDVDYQVGSFDHEATITDLLGVSDQAQVVGSGAAAFSDGVGVEDEILVSLDLVVTQDDAIGIADTPDHQATFATVLVDAVSIQDALVFEAVGDRAVDDLVGIADIPVSSLGVGIDVSDVIGLIDAVATDVFIAALIQIVITSAIRERVIQSFVRERPVTMDIKNRSQTVETQERIVDSDVDERIQNHSAHDALMKKE